MPRSTPAPLPGVITVDLVGIAAPVAAAKPAARAAAPVPHEVEPVPPAPKPVEAKPVAEAPKPEPPKPEPPKPVPAPPPRAEAVLPKKPEREPEKPKAKPEPKPEPEPPKQVAKAVPPKPAPEPPKPTPPKQESYDDLLAELRAEHGEAKPERVERPAHVANATGPAAGAPAGRSGAPVDPEFAGWVRAVQIHLSRAWILPPEMKSRKLMTELLVDLDAQGNVLSDPRIVRGSGDARFDDNAVRAVKKASPLPAPPAAGVQSIQFCPECG